MYKHLFAVIVELAGISVASIGIGFELTYHEPVGYVLITAGSVLIAAGSLIYAKIIRK